MKFHALTSVSINLKNCFYLSIFSNLFFLLMPSLQAQELPPCSTSEHYEKLIKANPEIHKNREIMNKKIKELLEKDELSNGVVTIPTVVHVISEGGPIGVGENIADCRIMAQIDQLNADFRRTNSDKDNTPFEFQDDAADTQIEFCLAQIDPNGNQTSGIQRFDFNTLNVSLADCWTADYIDTNIKIPTIWDSKLYLNIWVVPTIETFGSTGCLNGIGGYSQFPGMDPATDGVVLRDDLPGSIENPGSLSDVGRTGTHEVGHWLNLYHIFGKPCGGSPGPCHSNCDDDIEDTPDQKTAYNGWCPPHPQSSCQSHDMFMNYMDYTAGMCQNLFTKGQKDVMRAAIVIYRPELLSAPCQGPPNYCPDDWVLTQTAPGTLVNVREFEAVNTITASNHIAACADVDYHAGHFVKLTPGFHAKNGSSFQAFVQGCTSGTGGDPFVGGEGISNLLFAEPTAFSATVFPNPFREELKLILTMELPDMVSIYLYDHTGQKVLNLLEKEMLEAGKQTLTLQRGDLSTGIYFLSIQTTESRQVQSVILQ